MIRRIDLRGQAVAPDTDARTHYRAAVPRAEMDVAATLAVVEPIIDAVRERGLEAVCEFSARFDGVEQTDIRVPVEATHDALAALDPAVRAALEESIRRLRITSEAELEADVITEVVPGGTVTQRLVPIDRVGLYVPGGIAPLVSSVLMNVVPAQVAGVGSIALTSSPQVDNGGLPHPTILAACALLGVEEVYAVGGAQAIAMLAHGAGPCRPVDLVTGPGDIFTVSAKRLVKGVVGIDSEAGPTEIAVLADDSADPAFVAADLVSQAEHDPLAASVLVTDSETLADDVVAELDKQVSATRHVERIRTALTGPQSGIVMVDDLEQGLEVVNAYAAEHLSIQTRGRRRLGAPGQQRRGGLRRPVDARCRWATTAPAPTTCCPPAAAPATPRACRCGRSAQRPRHRVHRARRCRRRRTTSSSLADAEDLPGHGAAIDVRTQAP